MGIYEDIWFLVHYAETHDIHLVEVERVKEWLEINYEMMSPAEVSGDDRANYTFEEEM